MSDNPAQRLTTLVLPHEADWYAHASGRDDQPSFGLVNSISTLSPFWEATIPSFARMLPRVYFPNG